MKRTTRLIAAMLCIMLAFGCLAPASAAAAKLLQTGGSFYLTASTATATIIEPVRVDYAHGQTVKEALQASGHTFSGIESGFITAIDGVRGNFVRFYDYDESTGECGYDLDAAASDITAIGFAENEVASKEMIALITLMGDFNYSANGVLNYPAAKTAYADALRGLRNANAEQAQVLFCGIMPHISKATNTTLFLMLLKTVLQLKTPLSPLPTPTAMRAFTAEQPPRLMQVFQPIPFPTAGTTALRAG